MGKVTLNKKYPILTESPFIVFYRMFSCRVEAFWYTIETIGILM